MRRVSKYPLRQSTGGFLTRDDHSLFPMGSDATAMVRVLLRPSQAIKPFYVCRNVLCDLSVSYFRYDTLCRLTKSSGRISPTIALILLTRLLLMVDISASRNSLAQWHARGVLLARRGFEIGVRIGFALSRASSVQICLKPAALPFLNMYVFLANRRIINRSRRRIGTSLLM